MKINFITTGTKFPYSYYLGVMTALKAYGDDVVLWYIERPDSRYFKLLEDKEIEIKKSPHTKKYIAKQSVTHGLSEHELNVAAFDYLIWKIISEQGGIIAGLDSVNLKRWDDLLPDDKEMLVPRDSETDKESYAMHGVVVKKDSKLAKKIFEDICTVLEGKESGGKHKSLKDGVLKWGGLGIIPYLNNVYKNKDKIKIVKPGVIAGINKDCRKNGFYLHQQNGKLIAKDTRTIPLYATSNKDFHKIDEYYIANSGTLMARLIKKHLTYDEWNPFNLQVRGLMLDKQLPYKKMKKRFRFHLLGLSHLPTSEKYMACAFTQKNVKLSKMLLNLGHEVFLYGAEGSDAPCTHFIQTHTLKDIRDAWGEGDNRFEIGYNWKKHQFKHDYNSDKKPVTVKYYSNAVKQINLHKKDDDFLLITQGTYQRPIDKQVKLFLTCEPGIGYRGSYKEFRSFESTYIQNFTYGSEHPRKAINGKYYDRVIPNYFDPKDFPFDPDKEDYYLFMGRLIVRKGLDTAIKAVEAVGGKLKIAGQKHEETKRIPMHKDFCEYVGYADVKKRAKLMKKAKAVFCASTYLEPFCGVHAESMLCGTPVITTDFGAFSDYVRDGLNGYKCNTLQDFVTAAKEVENLDPYVIRKYAERFTLDSVKLEYQKWFQDLYRVYQSVKDKNKKAWHYLEDK